MRSFTVKIGSEIPTEAGYLKVTYINQAGLAYCDEYLSEAITTEDGDPDKMVKTGKELRLTLQEIARVLHRVDGVSYRVSIEA